MKTLALLAKGSHSSQLKQVEDLLKTEFEDLDVEVKVLSNAVNKWIQVSLSGEDEGIAASYVSKKIGLCPTNINSIQKDSVLKGYIQRVDAKKQGLIIDVGVFEPKPIAAFVPLASLQVQLFDDRKIALEKISQLYGLCEDVPISIKVVNNAGKEADLLQAELSTEQIERFSGWKQSLLERLIVLSLSEPDAERVLERTRLNRDVIGIESLGIFEQALTCKLGTNAAGVIAKIGKYLKKSQFITFNPWKILVLQV